MNFEDWFGTRLPPNYKPILNDAWQAAVEATKEACVEAVKNVDGWVCETGEYKSEWVVEQDEAIQAIRETEVP